MSTSSRTITTVRRSSAPRAVLLSTRAHVDLHDKGLDSLPGAQHVISVIKARKTVTKLILGHNALGDDGTCELFSFLCSDEGRRYRIAEISLNSNGIGNKGLEAVAAYVEGNESLRELFLQNNAFQGDKETAIKLSTALNSSTLELLSIASNQHLSDPFLIPFLSHLNSPTLRELQISAIGLTRASAPALKTFFTSARARALETLKCNGNALGARAVRKFLAHLRKTNFTLLKLEVYANAEPLGPGPGPASASASSASDDDAEEIELSVEEARAKWTASEADMKSMLLRNELLRRKVHEEALRLLTCARVLIMCSAPRKERERRGQAQEATYMHIPGPTTSQRDPSSESESKSTSTSTAFPFPSLPSELQQHILALLAPSLSSAQRARVFAFAADPATLRPLLPALLRSGSAAGSGGFGGSGSGGRGFGESGGGMGGCIPDPASLPFGSGIGGTGSPLGIGLGIGIGPSMSQNLDPSSPSPSSPGSPFSLQNSSPYSSPNQPRRSSPSPSPPPMSPILTPTPTFCTSGKCMGAGGSVLCHRAEVRMRWLAQVGCARFDMDGRGEGDVLWLLDVEPRRD